MVTKEEIPDEAICHICGQPMKVFDLSAEAERHGMRLPEANSYSIRCCDHELTVEDYGEFRRIRDLLAAYHGGIQPFE
jgi:hypothetical protein